MGSLWRGARFRSVSRSEAAHVVVRGQVIHRVQQLVIIDERSHCDERAEDAPQPECRGGDRDGQTARGLFFAEEAVWPEYSPKQINVTDRATILNFIIGLNGYTVCTGIDNGDLNNEKIVTVPLDTDETMLVGWVTNERAKLSKAAETYIEKLKSVVADHGYKLID